MYYFSNKFNLKCIIKSNIEVPVPSQESEWSCICVLELSIFPLSTIFLLDFGTVPTVVFFVFHFIEL